MIDHFVDNEDINEIRAQLPDYTKLHDSSVKMPKPKHPTREHQQQVLNLATTLLESHNPLTYKVKPGESRSEYRKRVQAQSIVREIKKNRKHFETNENSPFYHKSTATQNLLNRLLIKSRKFLRKVGKRDSKQYRWISEQWWKNYDRIGGYKSETSYRKIGDRSHKQEETKLQRALDSWK